MRIYYGWWIVAMSVVAMMLTLGTVVTGFGMFVVPVSEDMHLSRTSVYSGLVLINVGNVILSSFLGRILDIFPIRIVMAVCAVMFGIGLVTISLSHNVWISALALMIPVALGTSGAAALSFTTLVARWFEAQRGRAMAILVMGISIGTMVMPQIVSFLFSLVSWRECVMILGVAITAIFLAMIPFVRERPGPNDVEPGSSAAANAATIFSDEPAASAEPLKVVAILRMPVFWLYTLSVALALAAMQTTAASIVPLAHQKAVPDHLAAWLLTTIGATAILAKLVLAGVNAGFDRIKVLAILFFLIAISSVILPAAESFPVLLLCSAITGTAVGAVTPIFYALLADRVGAASFGTANGAATMIMSFFGIVALLFGGVVFDLTKSYDLMFFIFAAIGVLCSVLMLASRRYSGGGGACLISPAV